MTLRTSSIIHFFALLHVAAAILCRMWSLGDELILTTLTIVLTVILCLRYRQSVEFSSIVIIIANILGYVLGNGIAALVGIFIDHPLLSPAIATFTTTEAMGWGLVLFMRHFADRSGNEPKTRSIEITWLAIAVAMILVVRIIIYIFSSTLFEGGSVMKAVSTFVDNSFILLVMVCLTILFVEQTKDISRKKSTASHVITAGAFLTGISAISATLVGSGLPFHFYSPFSAKSFLELLLVAFIAEMMIYSVIYMIEYAITARRNAEKEKDRADLAKFQYLNLKQQVNPHFLFNSLNILDALVLDGQNKEASEYIHKLAGIYRYMLRNEEESVVTLRDEMTYVEMYRDLLKVRFQEGFNVKVSIPPEDLSKHVIPCSVQLLIENATKHNAVSPSRPLNVSVVSDGETLTVTNNLIPKITEAQSSGLGLNYIRQQYRDRSGKGIEIIRTDDFYTVKLPLL